jgi:hypothetical protein
MSVRRFGLSANVAAVGAIHMLDHLIHAVCKRQDSCQCMAWYTYQNTHICYHATTSHRRVTAKRRPQSPFGIWCARFHLQASQRYALGRRGWMALSPRCAQVRGWIGLALPHEITCANHMQRRCGLHSEAPPPPPLSLLPSNPVWVHLQGYSRCCCTCLAPCGSIKSSAFQHTNTERRSRGSTVSGGGAEARLGNRR